MNNLKPYGFILSDKPGKGQIKRFINTDTIFVAPASRTIQMINIAQEVLDFDSAYSYIQTAAKEHELDLKLFTEQDIKKDCKLQELINKIIRRK